MLIRIRSKDGNFRFEVSATDDVSVLVKQILDSHPNIDPSTLALSNSPRGGEKLVSEIQGSIQQLGLSHGDLLFASYTSNEAAQTNGASSSLTNGASTTAASTSSKPTTSSTAKKPWEMVTEDKVDQYWEKQDGKIQRKKGQGLCKCGPKSMCDHCMPLEPFDAGYQQEHNIKHLSFHSYLRKITSAQSASAQSNSYIPPLEDPSYKVQVPCSSGNHPSWPAGICTKCQPSAVTLTRQPYRLVDHVEFASPNIIDQFLSFWRSTGTQRFGYLIGHYEPYDKVPMGIKAVVEAIHEPPQEGHADGVSVGFPWDDEERISRLAQACDLSLVGMIYTDLVTSEEDRAKVVPKRHANSFFLSSLEAIFSATLQRKYQNKSRFAAKGQFSSKFVTCVLTGNLEGGIEVQAYQVSDQAMAMVDADMIEASVEANTVRVKEEGPTRYIPDVFFRYKNKYGLEVKESAKPCFPVEYLLVNVTHGFPNESNPIFVSLNPFVPANRTGYQDQTMRTVATRFVEVAKSIPQDVLTGEALIASSEKGKGREDDAFKLTTLLAWLSDWHLIAYLDSVGLFDPHDMQLMARAASSKDLSLLVQLLSTGSWQTFLTIAEAEAPPPPSSSAQAPGHMASSDEQQQPTMIDGFEIPPDVDVPPDQFHSDAGGGAQAGGAGASASDTGVVVCPHCTFENAPGSTDCEICGLPLSG